MGRKGRRKGMRGLVFQEELYTELFNSGPNKWQRWKGEDLKKPEAAGCYPVREES